MASTKNHLPVEYDEDDLNDAELWAVIDFAAAASHSSSSKSRKPLALTNGIQSHSPVANYSPAPKFARSPVSNYSSPAAAPPPPPPPPKFTRSPVPNYSSPAPKFTRRSQYIVKEEKVRASTAADGEVLQESTLPWIHQRPQKIARATGPGFGEDKRMVVVNHVQQLQQITPFYSSPDPGRLSVEEISPMSESSPFPFQQSDGNQAMAHSLSGRFPSVPLFKEYQNAAMAILEQTDYTIISGSPFIKKSGWRKISFYFNLSFEIKDKNIEFDENRNVQRAEFVVRAYMKGGRFSDGWGSCDRREKRFMKPNHDIPSTAETRAKNKACQDLLGIGSTALVRAILIDEPKTHNSILKAYLAHSSSHCQVKK